MNSRMEENRCIYEWLVLLGNGYMTGDFGDVFPVLAKDCILESQWVLRPNTGYDEVTYYLTGKGKTLARTGNFPRCAMVELVGNSNPVKGTNVSINGGASQAASVMLMYTPCKPALYLEQTVNGETNGMIIDIRVDDKGMIKRIDLCLPELFRFRSFYQHMKANPANTTGNRKDGADHLVRINQPYFLELYMFLPIPGLGDGEYNYSALPLGEFTVNMDKWCDALEKWRAFIGADSFDEAFRLVAGVDSETKTIRNPEAARYLSEIGMDIWQNRMNSRQMLKDLSEWTGLYRDSYRYVRFESSR